MAIKPLKRVENYFSGFKKIKADSIDLQFNIISDYLNKQILPILKTLSTDKIPGSINPADANKFLQNVGDYSTKWASINNDSFGVNSLSLEKLVKTNVGGIIATGSDQIFKGIAATENNQALTSKDNDYPIWKKLSSVNIEDRAITGDNVADATITNENLPAYLIETLIANNSITGDKFKDNSITSIKIANQTLKVDKLSPELALDFPSTVWSNIIPNEYLATINSIFEPIAFYQYERSEFIRLLNPKNIPPLPAQYNYSGFPYATSINVVFPITKFKGDFIPPLIHAVVKSSTKLKINDIEASRVLINAVEGAFTSTPFNFEWRRDLNKILANQSVGLEHLTPDLRQKLLGAK
jgi:hypothetical protein